MIAQKRSSEQIEQRQYLVEQLKQQHLRNFEFVGRVIGKALYEGILLDVEFASFFLSKWLGRQNTLDDLQSLDRDLYDNLMKLKKYNGDIRDLELTFSIDEEEYGVVRSFNLIPNGAAIPVTNANLFTYITHLAHHKLNTRLARQTHAFFRGLSDLISASWLQMFSATELQTLLSGSTADIDVDDWEANTVYGGFEETAETVRLFWIVVRSLDGESRRRVLRFATSCRRPPLRGFSELVPKFSLRCTVGENDSRL
ncbi:hypothetical protein HK096_001225, partial [Nowakowskiella sp. JEL0078]